MDHEFDIAVIGGGTAGMSAVKRASELGAKVCLVEEGPLGGYSFNQGTFFIRYLLSLVKNHASTETPLPPLSDLFASGKKMGHDVSLSLKNEVANLGITLFEGHGSIINKNQIQIDGTSVKELVKAKNIIICTGSIPKPIATIPFDKDIQSTDTFLNFTETPSHLLVVGGNKVGVEVSHLFNVLGSKVFLVEENARLIADKDPELISILESVFKQQKIKTLLNKKLISILKKESEIDITLDGGIKFSVNKTIFECERIGNCEYIGIKKISLEQGKNHEIWVNEKMETSSPGIYAAGSVTGHQHSAELSEEEGKVAAENALKKETVLNLEHIPFRLFSNPEICSVGSNLEEAHHKGYRGVEGRSTYESLEVAELNNKIEGICKIVVDRDTRKIIGAQIAGPHAHELLTLVLLALKRGSSIKVLSQISCGSGQYSRLIQEAAKDCLRSLIGAR